MVIWGFDVSSWQAQGSMIGNNRWDLSDLNRFPLDRMRENGCRFGIVKASMQLSKDATAADHGRLIKSADMDLGVYHWDDPIANYPLQKRLFAEQIADLRPFVKADDVEQYWSDWKDHTKILSENKIVDNFKYLYFDDPVVRSLIYTAKWFTDKYVPTRYAELNLCDLWVAHYTMSRNYAQAQFGTYNLTSWDQFLQLVNYIATEWRTFYNNSTPSRMLFPKGFGEWTVFQIDSILKLPGCPYNIDLNVFNGTEKEYDEWAGHEVTPLPPPPPPPTNGNMEARVALLETQMDAVLRKQEDVGDLWLSGYN